MPSRMSEKDRTSLPVLWALVARARAGDTDAYADLYRILHGSVFRFVYARVGNRQLAEDITADTFTRGLARIGSLQETGSSPAGWFVTIARNLTADYFKSGRYRRCLLTAEVQDDEVAAVARVVREEMPDEDTLSYLTAKELWRAVKELGKDQQECIVLRFAKGFSVTETAQSMGKQEGAIKALQYRAVRALGRMDRVRDLMPELIPVA